MRRAWAPGGYLEQRGLIPLPEAERQAAAQAGAEAHGRSPRADLQTDADVMTAVVALLAAGTGLRRLARRRAAKAMAFARAAAARPAPRPHSLPNYHGWYVALVGGGAGAALPGRLEQRSPAASIFQQRDGEPGGAGAAGLRHAAPGDPQRGLCARHRRVRRRAFNPQARALAPVYARGDRLLRLDRPRAGPADRLRRRRLRLSAGSRRISAPGPGSSGR